MSEEPLTGYGEPAIRVMMMPRDTNAQGTIFGGVLLSYIDQAGAVRAREMTRTNVVTVAMSGIEFKKPVYVGDLLSFYAKATKTGRSSMTIQVIVEAERWSDPSVRVRVTQAEAVYVAVDDDFHPTPVFAGNRV